MEQKKLRIQGSFAAFICGLCFVIGIVTLNWLAPDIYTFPEGRLRVIEQYGWLLHVWHFIVFPLVGICVFTLNRSLIKQSSKPLGSFATICTIVACVALAHDIAIFSIETMSNEMFIKQQFNTHHEQAQITMGIYSVLNKLRASTEWGIDLWLCLITIFMLVQGRFHPLHLLFGFSCGVLGVLVLLIPSFHHFESVYLYAMSLWFLSTGVWLAVGSRSGIAAG